jgi:flagellar motility protein MotE (MotC chaperone)
MTDEAQNTTNQGAAPDAAAAPTKAGKGGLIKYAVFGLGGIVLIVLIAFGTLMLVGTGGSQPTTAESSAGSPSTENLPQAHATPDSSAATTDSEDTTLSWLEDSASVLDAILENLKVLDYKPTEAEMAGEEVGMSEQDSIEAANWLAQEKKRLNEREKALDAREKELNVLDTKLSQKILQLEQAESARIAKLAKLYDGMDPRSVARLVANLDDATVVALLPRMKPKNASQVLALMPPVRAANLSKQMITIAEN